MSILVPLRSAMLHRLVTLFVPFAYSSVAIAAPPAVTAVAYLPDGKHVAFGRTGEVRLLDAGNGESRGFLKTAGRVTAAAIAPNGKWLAVASGESGKDGVIQTGFSDGLEQEVLCNLPAMGISPLPATKTRSTRSRSRPDSRTLATAGYDRMIHVWDVSDGRAIGKLPRLTLKDHSDTIYSLSFHPDGQLLASGAADRAVKVWDTATGKRLYTLGDPTDWVYCVAWSPDKKHLIAGGVDKSVRMWAADRNGGKLVHSVYAHEKAVWRVAYADGGATVFTAGEDRIIKAWNASNMSEKKVFSQQPEAILDFAVSPVGKQLAVARFDGVGELLDMATGKQTTQLLPPKPATPKPEKFVPTGVPIGKTTTLTVTGKDLDTASDVNTSRPEVKFQIVERAPGSLTLSVTVPTQLKAEVIDLTLSSEAGKSGPLKLALDPFDSVVESGVTDSARAAQRLKLPATVIGAIDRAGDVDFFKFDAKAGDEIGIRLIASEAGSKLAGVWPEPLPTSAASTSRASDPAIARAGRGPVSPKSRDAPSGALIDGRALFMGSFEGFLRTAEISDRADNAIGPRSTDESAQIHQGRVVDARVPTWQQISRVLPQRFAAGAGINRNLEIEEAGEQTRDVRFDDRNRSIEGERGHGVRGVTANSRQVPDRIQRLRESGLHVSSMMV